MAHSTETEWLADHLNEHAARWRASVHREGTVEEIARIIAPSAFAQIKSRTDGTPTGGLKYADRQANRDKALAKASAILAFIQQQAVARFLAWRLPADFSPDAGITFKPDYNEGSSHPMRHEPCGTNLFDARQAEAMVRHMIVNQNPAPKTEGGQP